MLTRIDHVGLAVRDLDAAIAFYARTFDMRVVHEEVNEEQGVREAMLAVGGTRARASSCWRRCAPDSPIGKFLDRNGPGIQQVAYRVDDIDAASADAARARACGCSTTSRGAARPARGSTSCTPRTPGGVWSSWSEPSLARRTVGM